jgi:hypothetical protein
MKTKLLFSLIILLSITSCSEKKHSKVFHSSGTEVAIRIIRISYCGSEYLQKTPSTSMLNEKDTLTMRFGLRSKFISLMNRAEIIESVSVYIKSINSSFGDSTLHNMFNADQFDSDTPVTFDICDISSYAAIYSKSDTLRDNINTFITVSKPLILDSGKVLYYYELGTRRNKMDGGVIIMSRDKKGELVPLHEKTLWIN